MIRTTGASKSNSGELRCCFCLLFQNGSKFSGLSLEALSSLWSYSSGSSGSITLQAGAQDVELPLLSNERGTRASGIHLSKSAETPRVRN